MKKLKKVFLVMLTLLFAFSFTACGAEDEGDILYVGNTASVTGGHETIGVPFNVGINAAFKAWNDQRKKSETKVALKHYDDGGVAANSATLTEKLIYEDEVFAIVGNYGSTSVAANIDVIKDAQVPMVYAAAGNDVLLNENATTLGDRGIFPVQPLSSTEGRMLYARATKAASYDGTTMTGGLGGTKIGVISDTSEASIQMTGGIRAEAGSADVSYQSSTTAGDFASAATAIKSAGCDVVILTVIGTQFTAALKALANAEVTAKVITTYNNSSAAVFNDSTSTLLLSEYTDVFSKLAIYAQGWLDISSLTYVYDSEATASTPLAAAYKALQEGMGMTYAGVSNFNEAYWAVAEDIFDYCVSAKRADGLTMSYNSFALAGYIAGNMFTQGIDALEAAGKELTRENYVDIMESKEFNVAMGDKISFANGKRVGVQTFSLTQIFDAFGINGIEYHTAAAVTVQPLMTLDAFRAAA